jgi:hypothetical protein
MQLKSVIFYLAMGLMILLFNSFVPSLYQVKEAWYIFVYLMLTGFLANVFLIKTNKKSPKDFIKFYMGITGLRLLFNLMVIAVFALVNKERAIPFTMAFLVLYIFFLVFEVVMLITETKKQH